MLFLQYTTYTTYPHESSCALASLRRSLMCGGIFCIVNRHPTHLLLADIFVFVCSGRRLGRSRVAADASSVENQNCSRQSRGCTWIDSCLWYLIIGDCFGGFNNSENICIPVWIFSWCLNPCKDLKASPHSSHLNGLFSSDSSGSASSECSNAYLNF